MTFKASLKPLVGSNDLLLIDYILNGLRPLRKSYLLTQYDLNLLIMMFRYYSLGVDVFAPSFFYVHTLSRVKHNENIRHIMRRLKDKDLISKIRRGWYQLTPLAFQFYTDYINVINSQHEKLEKFEGEFLEEYKGKMNKFKRSNPDIFK